MNQFCLDYVYRDHLIFKLTGHISDDCSDLMLCFQSFVARQAHAFSGILSVTFFFNVYTRLYVFNVFLSVFKVFLRLC